MTRWFEPKPYGYERDIRQSLEEDLLQGDPSSLGLRGRTFDWVIEAQAEGVVSGLQIAAFLLNAARDPWIADGQFVEPGTIVLKGSGAAPFVMSMERTALNFLTFLSGTATLTRAFVRAVEHTSAIIVDTRKTIPGCRALQKYAVRCGGGHNHRFNLGDGVILKDNHIAAAGSILSAVRDARAVAPHLLRIEVECETEIQVDEAVRAGADVVMLDNMDVDQMRSIVSRYNQAVVFEASGGVTIDSVQKIAEAGVNVISIGALTHSAPALKFHLEPV